MELDAFVYRLAGSLPVLIVWIIGGWLCMRNSWRNATVCSLVGIALALSLGIRFVLPVILNPLLRWFNNGMFGPGNNMNLFMFVYSFIYSIPTAIVWGLLLWAIFGRAGLLQNREFDPYGDFPTTDGPDSVEQPRLQ